MSTKTEKMFDVDLETLRQNLMAKSPVMFTYFKMDGTARTAMGTLNEDLIPEDQRPKDSSTNFGDNLKYYDLEKKGWRSLAKDCKLVTMFE